MQLDSTRSKPLNHWTLAGYEMADASPFSSTHGLGLSTGEEDDKTFTLDTFSGMFAQSCRIQDEDGARFAFGDDIDPLDRRTPQPSMQAMAYGSSSAVKNETSTTTTSHLPPRWPSTGLDRPSSRFASLPVVLHDPIEEEFIRAGLVEEQQEYTGNRRVVSNSETKYEPRNVIKSSRPDDDPELKHYAYSKYDQFLSPDLLDTPEGHVGPFVRPIPALHGPPSLPYARCPSGAEGEVFYDQQSVRDLVWNIEAEPGPEESIFHPDYEAVLQYYMNNPCVEDSDAIVLIDSDLGDWYRCQQRVPRHKLPFAPVSQRRHSYGESSRDGRRSRRHRLSPEKLPPIHIPPKLNEQELHDPTACAFCSQSLIAQAALQMQHSGTEAQRLQHDAELDVGLADFRILQNLLIEHEKARLYEEELRLRDRLENEVFRIRRQRDERREWEELERRGMTTPTELRYPVHSDTVVGSVIGSLYPSGSRPYIDLSSLQYVAASSTTQSLLQMDATALQAEYLGINVQPSKHPESTIPSSKSFSPPRICGTQRPRSYRDAAASAVLDGKGTGVDLLKATAPDVEQTSPESTYAAQKLGLPEDMTSGRQVHPSPLTLLSMRQASEVDPCLLYQEAINQTIRGTSSVQTTDILSMLGLHHDNLNHAGTSMPVARPGNIIPQPMASRAPTVSTTRSPHNPSRAPGQVNGPRRASQHAQTPKPDVPRKSEAMSSPSNYPPLSRDGVASGKKGRPLPTSTVASPAVPPTSSRKSRPRGGNHTPLPPDQPPDSPMQTVAVPIVAPADAKEKKKRKYKPRNRPSDPTANSGTPVAEVGEQAAKLQPGVSVNEASPQLPSFRAHPHERSPMANPPAPPPNGESGPLSHTHIAQAMLVSTDGGQTLDFSHKNITEVKDEASHELAKIGREDDDDEGCVTRIALVYNSLSTLPMSFALISRLRYLNLRSNYFTVFPDVLCNMPSLEILDISRNKLKRLPSRSGTLKNLRVFSFTKNRVERLPSYFSEFVRLRMLKIEHNPIEWPPARVLRRTQDGDEGMEAWIQDLQAWFKNNPDEEQQPAASRSSGTSSRAGQVETVLPSDDEVHQNTQTAPHANGSSSVTHSRAPSDESMTSGATRHFTQPVPFAEFSLSDGSPLVNSVPQSFSSFGGSSLSTSAPFNGSEDFLNSQRDDSLLSGGTIHGRNASTSLMGARSNSASAGLFAKKSLPDLRSAHLNESFARSHHHRRLLDSRRPSDEPALPPISLVHQSPRDGPGSRPSTRPSATASNVTAPVAAERNSYFKRFSTLPSSSISKTIPESMLKTVDAIRGIFFAVGQMHSAIQHYTVFGTDERQSSGVLGRLMNGASEFMLKLMAALDRFDSLSRRGLPPPSVCRELIEACRDNVAISIKVVGVLNAQLKVLAGTDDLRFARTSLLMLYGAMAEVSNSWHALAPHIEAIQPLLNDFRPPPAARSHGASSSSTTPGRPPIIPISKSPTSPPRNIRVNNVPQSSATATKPTTRSMQRRNAGSFSYKDVQIGRSLAASSPASTPDTSAVISASSSSSSSTVVNGNGNLKSALRNPFNPSSPTPSPPVPSTIQVPPAPLTTHSRENSLNSNTAKANPIPVISRPPGAPSSAARSRTSDLPGSAQLVDRDLLATMDAACDTALAACSLIEEESFGDEVTQARLREMAEKARTTSTTLKQDIDAVRAGYLEAEKKALWEDANAFAKTITQIALLLKPHTARMSVNLRSHIEKLINSTKEYTILLSVSSFAPVARPFSPAFAPVGADHGNPRSLGASSVLGRSRSATATQELGPSRVVPPQQNDVPWSAMPHQSFRVPNPSSLQGQRLDEEDERLQRRV
ncbi:RAM signaling network component [Tulasnella sp. 403]|nr:RAM signaling network component [Tulasnella sp. 403]